MVDIDQIQADIDFVENDPDNFWATVRAVWRLYLAVPGLLAEVRLLRHRLHKWEEWKPDDETLAGLKEQAAGARSRAASTDYIGALAWYLRKATADSVVDERDDTDQAIGLLKRVLTVQVWPDEVISRATRMELVNDIQQFLKEHD